MAKTIDLHGYTVHEALREFVRSYNAALARGYRGQIEVIHGYGSSGAGGKIGPELLAFLRANRNKLEQITPGKEIGNAGITIVYPKHPLPERDAGPPDFAEASLERAILDFCATPKAESKIITKLCGRFGDRQVRSAIRRMVKNGHLRTETQDGRVLYQVK